MKNVVRMLGVVCALALAIGLPLMAQEPAKVAGKWEFTFQGPQGPITQTLTLEQNGADIKGTMAGQRGEAPVTGKVSGKNITFSITRETPRGTMTTEYKGTVEGDSMKGTMTMRDREVEWTAKKAK